eukprot:gene5577-6266_t
MNFDRRRHHCVHRPRSDGRGRTRCLLTEYNDTFREFSNARRATPIKPENKTKVSSQPMDKSTMYKDTYVPYKYQPPEKHVQTDYVKPSGTMKGNSTYQTDYLEKKGMKLKPARPDDRPVASDIPFDDSTVHKETYKQWEMPKFETFHPPNRGIRKSDGKFDHVTTVQHDFPGYYGKLGREPMHPPESSLKTGSGIMSDQTTNRNDYTKKFAQPEKSAKPEQNRIHHSAPFESQTTNQHAFTWPDGTAADSCKPIRAAFASNRPFEGNTTHNSTYKKWEVARMEGTKPQVSWKPSGEPFNHSTTFRDDFKAKYTPVAKSARPMSIRADPGEFRDLTTHNETFKAWGISVRDKCMPSAGYRPTSAPFHGQTTMAADYTGKKTTRPDICLPKDNSIRPIGSQEFTTNYGDDYIKKKLPPCPATDLVRGELGGKSSSRGYRFAKENNGHQFYFKSMENIGMHERIETLALA